MSLTLKPYPAYRDVNLPWTPIIPIHWKVERSKRLFLRMQRPVRPYDEVVTCFRDGTVTLRKNRRIEGYTESLKEIGYQGVRRGDLVIHAMDAFAGAIGVSDSDGKSTPVYAVCQPKPGINAQYYASVIREMARSQWVAALARGIRERSTDFRYETFADEFVPQPPADEQIAISSFISHLDVITRKLIRAKQRVTKLLKEEQGTIQHELLTTGTWSMLPVKRCAIVISKGTTPSTEGHVILDQGPVRFIKAENIQNGSITDSPHWFISDETHKVLNRSQLQTGDVLFVIAGATLGKVAVVLESQLPANTNQAVSFVRPNTRILPEFLAMCLQSHDIKERTWLSCVQSAQPNLSMAELGSFRIPVPPIEEQCRVLALFQERARNATLGIDAAQREISLLREYRSRLTSDVVTGKLDVRGVELVGIEEVEELEQSDTTEEMESDETIVAAQEADNADN